jgi:hypothetical protein
VYKFNNKYYFFLEHVINAVITTNIQVMFSYIIM